MLEFMERPVGNPALRGIIYRFKFHAYEWKTLKTVCVVKGLSGSGKTAYLLDYFKNQKVFYFSFDGLEENLAEKLFAGYVSEKTGVNVSCWSDALSAVSKAYKVILFDDLTSISSYKRFPKAFYDCVITDIYTRPFVVLISQQTDNLENLADRYVTVGVDYFSIPFVMKLFRGLSKHDILGLCAASGGIPKILNEYDKEISYADNLRNMLKQDSAFSTFMPEMLSKYFRKPECYHHILYAIANGCRRISEIGQFTGCAYNKCDNYLSALISVGIVKAEKETMKTGTEKTVYTLSNNYFRLWYLYVFPNRAGLATGDSALSESIIERITSTEIHQFHIHKAFELANKRATGLDLWQSFRITKIVYSPQTIGKDSFRYTFDAIARNGDKVIFIKVFEDELENCKKDELEKIRLAMSLTNKYYDSHIMIFSKRRFSDHAVAEAAKDETISLVEVDRLKY